MGRLSFLMCKWPQLCCLLTNTEVVVVTMFSISRKSIYSSKHITNYKLIKLYLYPREERNYFF